MSRHEHTARSGWAIPPDSGSHIRSVDHRNVLTGDEIAIVSFFLPAEYPLARAMRLRDAAITCGAHPRFVERLMERVREEARRVWNPERRSNGR